MKSLGFDLRGAKKTASDSKSSTFQLKGGHKITIAHAPLSHSHRKQLEALPLQKMAEGDPDVEPVSSDDQVDPNQLALERGTTSQNTPSQDTTGATDGDGYYRNDKSSPNLAIEAIPDQDQNRAPASGATSAPNPMTLNTAAFKQEQAANTEAAQAQGTEGSEEAQALQSTSDQTSQLPTQQDIIQRNAQADDTLMQAYRSQTIDPNKYWDNHSKIAAGIGMILGGAGAHSTGGQNLALQNIDRQISNEIDAQKANKTDTLNLWQMNRQHLGTDLAANLATQNQLYTGLKYKLEQAAANAKGPMALANAHAANARIQQEINSNNFKLSLMSPTSDIQDPAQKLGLMTRVGLIPEQQVSKIAGEIDAAKDTVANAPGILQAFDQASKEVRPMTGGADTSLTAFIPGMKSAGQSAMIARLGPTFKDVEGTVRQAAMDNMERNTVPHFGDSDETIATKRNSLIQYLRSKEAASTAKAYNIDLSQYPSTSSRHLGQPGGPGAPQIQGAATSRSGKPIVWRNGKAYYK